MKHIFVINPKAGKEDATPRIRKAIEGLEVDQEMYVTREQGDATRFVRQYCEENPTERLRFYACGGDGTMNEVVTGLIGFDNAEISCCPMGSGNDYVKYYGGEEIFLDMARLVASEAKPVDVMKVGDRYSLNVCNFGFDAIVCKTMMQVRRKWLIGGSNAYTTGIVKALFTGRRTECRITVDGEVINDGEMLLCTLGNGRYVGGGYQCSPLSMNDDGLIEVCLFKPITITRFAKLIGPYRDGTFIQRPDIADIMSYKRGKSIEIESSKPIDFCIDGEMLFDSHFHIEELAQAVRFAAPTGG